MDIDEQIRIWAFCRSGGKLFVGFSGLGLMTLDEKTGEWHRIFYPLSGKNHQVTGLASAGNSIFMSTMEGFYHIYTGGREL